MGYLIISNELNLILVRFSPNGEIHYLMMLLSLISFKETLLKCPFSLDQI